MPEENKHVCKIGNYTANDISLVPTREGWKWQIILTTTNKNSSPKPKVFIGRGVHWDELVSNTTIPCDGHYIPILNAIVSYYTTTL